MKGPQAGRSPEAGASRPRGPSPLLHHLRAVSLCSCLSRPVSLIPPGYHRSRTLLLSPGALLEPNFLEGLSLHRGPPLRLPPSPSLPAPASGLVGFSAESGPMYLGPVDSVGASPVDSPASGQRRERSFSGSSLGSAAPRLPCVPLRSLFLCAPLRALVFMTHELTGPPGPRAPALFSFSLHHLPNPMYLLCAQIFLSSPNLSSELQPQSCQLDTSFGRGYLSMSNTGLGIPFPPLPWFYSSQ